MEAICPSSSPRKTKTMSSEDESMTCSSIDSSRLTAKPSSHSISAMEKGSSQSQYGSYTDPSCSLMGLSFARDS